MKKSTAIITTLIATVGISVPTTIYVAGQNNLAETQAKQEFATSTSVSSETQQSYAYSSAAKEQQEQQAKTEAAIEAKYENDNAEELSQEEIQLLRTLEKNGYTISENSKGKTVQTCVQQAMCDGFTDFYEYNKSPNSTMTRRLSNDMVGHIVICTAYKDNNVVVFYH